MNKALLLCYIIVSFNIGRADFLVMRQDQSANPSAVFRFNEVTGEFISEIARVSGRYDLLNGLAFGDNGTLYIPLDRDATKDSVILRYNWKSGEFLGEFGPTLTNTFGMNGLCFGPDGNLYVCIEDKADEAGKYQSHILKLDAKTGETLGKWYPTGLDGVLTFVNLAFGADGDLYVTDIQHGVLRFRGSDGAYLGIFAPLGFATWDVTFGPDGNMYVVYMYGISGGEIRKIDARTGQSLGVFVPQSAFGLPKGFVFGPDKNLYVSDRLDGTVKRFNGATGQFIDIVVPHDFGLFDPMYMAFTPIRLNVERSGAQLSISWPQTSAPVRLESTVDLPAQLWQPTTDVPSILDNENLLSWPIESQRQYFRLAEPSH